MQRTLISSLAMVAALMSVGNGAFAHDDGTLDKISGPNGGQLRMAGSYHFELVVAKDSKEAKDNPVVVYVTDHAGTKVPTAGAKGTVTILSGKAKVTVSLIPDGDNRLKGSGAYASAPDMKAIVSVTLPNKSPEQARFTPLDKPMLSTQDGHAGHSH